MKDIDVLGIVNSNPQAAAVFSKLVQTRSPIGTHLGEGINTTAVSSKAMESARRQNDTRTSLELFSDVKLAANTLISLLLSPGDGVQTEFHYENKLDIGLPANAIAEIMELVKEYLENDFELRERVHEIAKKVILEDGANPILVLPESSLEHFLNNPGTAITAESDTAATQNLMMGLQNEINKIIDPQTKLPRNLGILRAPSPNGDNFTIAMESAFGIKTKEYDPRIKFKLTGESNVKQFGGNNPNEKKVTEVQTKLILTDNIGVLRLPTVKTKLREMKAERVLEASRLGYNRFDDPETPKQREAIKLNDDQIRSTFYRQPGSPTVTPFAIIKDPNLIKRKTIGKPSIIDLPPESLMVIPELNNPKRHMYYIAMVDMDGHFIKLNNYQEMFNSLSRNFAGHTDTPDNMTSQLMQIAKTRIEGDKTSQNENDLEYKEMVRRIYQQLTETNLKSYIRSSLGEDEITLSTSNNQIYEIMFARELANRQTQLLLIPANLVSYFAFNYDDHGIGRSLLDESRNILSVRTMLMAAEIFNSVRNAISRTNVEIGFDSRDRDPMSSFEAIKTRILNSRGGFLPWGILDLGLVSQQIQRAGVEFTFTGDNKLMPNTSIRFNESQSQHQRMDETFREDLRRLSIAGFSMTPELLDSASNEELATAIKENKAQLARRVSIMSTELNKRLKEFVRRILRYDGNIYDRIQAIIIKNIKPVCRELYKSKALPKEVMSLLERDEKTGKLNKKNVWRFVKYATDSQIDAIECTLPTHKRNTFSERIKELEEGASGLDFLLENIINDESLKTIFDGNTEQLEAYRASMKSHIIREWFAESGLITEFSRFIEKPNSGLTNPTTKEISAYNQNLVSLIMGLASTDKKIGEIVKTISESIGLNTGDDNSSSGDSSSDSNDSSSDSDSDSGGGDSGGDDDMFGDIDSMFDEPASDSEGDGGESEDKPEENKEESETKETETKTDDAAT